MIIKGHNKKLLNNEKIKDESCNCRNSKKCPLKGDNCSAENIIYKASVSTKMKLIHSLDLRRTKKRREFPHTMQQLTANLVIKTTTSMLTQQNFKN